MILIVDADEVSAPSLARLLRYNGHAAEVTPSSSEALALLPTAKPAAIVLELALPDIGGIAMIHAIRADPSYRDVPVIVYTSDYTDAARKEALAAGARDVIVKGTLGTHSLLARIEKHLLSNDAT